MKSSTLRSVLKQVQSKLYIQKIVALFDTEVGELSYQSELQSVREDVKNILEKWYSILPAFCENLHAPLFCTPVRKLFNPKNFQ